jgi:hypothetical protein
LKIVFQIEIENNNVKFHANCDGRPLTRLESAHQLTKICSGLIRDGIVKDTAGRLIIPAAPEQFQIKA